MPATITPADNSAVFVEGARKFRRQSASRGAVDVLSTSRSKAFHERLRQLHMTLVRATPAFLLGFVIAQKFLVSSVLTASSSLKLSSPSPNTNLTVPDSVVALTLQNNALGLSATEFLLATTSCVASLLHIATLLQEPHEARRTIAMTLFAIAAICKPLKPLNLNTDSKRKCPYDYGYVCDAVCLHTASCSTVVVSCLNARVRVHECTWAVCALRITLSTLDSQAAVLCSIRLRRGISICFGCSPRFTPQPIPYRVSVQFAWINVLSSMSCMRRYIERVR
eukprot:m.271231 g.271231  ORF g.271231 m.271231 type:complete len:280 (-) comp15683_c1_seq3:123-962(-)